VAAEAIRVDGGRLEATLTAPRDGVAVVLDPWFPGWRASIDGSPAPLARADVAFMAVPLRAGRHRLELAYAPAQLGRGIAVAAAALALLGGLLLARRGGGRAQASDLPRAPKEPVPSPWKGEG
jgi:uncharacterized membrane protein YfhO